MAQKKRTFICRNEVGKILTLFDVFSATLRGWGVWVWTMGKMIEKSEISTRQLWGK